MKNILYILLAAVLFTGCKDWFEVSTHSENRESEMFAHEEGFKSALTGVYIKLASESLYGANTSFLVPDAITQHWVIASRDNTTPLPALSRFEYTDQKAETCLKTIWETYYSAVGQLNNILDNLETTSAHFSNDNDKLTRAEALGLRGFIHFEVLRMFGPVPATAAPSDKAIPYVDQLTKDPNLLLSDSWSEVIRRIGEDLDAAEALLAGYDPILFYTNAVLNDASNYPFVISDRWHLKRQIRMNYWAVKAIKARYYLWIGDTENAVKYASQVIQETDSVIENLTGRVKERQFELATATYLGNVIDKPTLTFYIENLFGLHNSKHQTVCNKYFGIVQESSYPLYMVDAQVQVAFESGINPADIRYADKRYWVELDNTTMDNVITYAKYIGNNILDPNNIIPVIRLSEMYLILIECLPIDQARNYFEQFRIARVLNEDLTNQLDETTRLDMVESEYRKEFYGEGQMFYFYKRRNYTLMTWPEPIALDASVYVIPKPDSQTIFE